MIKPDGFDDGQEEFKNLPAGFSIRKPRRPKKRNIPDWVYDDKLLKNKIFKEAERDAEVARLYWRVGLTTKEIAGELLGDGKKFRLIESIVYRLKNL